MLLAKVLLGEKNYIDYKTKLQHAPGNLNRNSLRLCPQMSQMSHFEKQQFRKQIRMASAQMLFVKTFFFFLISSFFTSCIT